MKFDTTLDLKPNTAYIIRRKEPPSEEELKAWALVFERSDIKGCVVVFLDEDAKITTLPRVVLEGMLKHCLEQESNKS